jgi:hypothetical protein
MKKIYPNDGKIVQQMRDIQIQSQLGNISPLELPLLLQALTSKVRTSPRPHRPTGIAKARRAAKARHNIQKRTTLRYDPIARSKDMY